jgi:hypothetical protein
MPQRRHRHGPKPDRRRAFELLAAAFHDGVTEALMLAHGFTVDRMVELVRAGLATAHTERIVGVARGRDADRDSPP